MAPITSDLEALWDLQDVLYDVGPGLGLPAPLLQSLREVFRADEVGCNSMDSRAQSHDFSQSATGDGWVELGAVPAPEDDLVFWRHYWESSCSLPERTGDTETILRISDVHGRAAWHATPMYAEYLRPYGVEHEMMLVLHDGGRGRSVRLLLSRGDGPDFTDRDVFLLELLKPHLRGAWARCEAVRTDTSLTRRQRDVLRLVLEGATNQAIGRRLGIAEGTVRTHLQNSYAVLGVSSRTAAAVRAARLG